MSDTPRYPSRHMEMLHAMMRPLVRFGLRHTHSFKDFVFVAKAVFVEVAAEELKRTSPKINVSRIAVMTGMYREDVRQIYQQEKKAPEEPLNLLWRVIGQWRHDKRFLTKSGDPRPLSYRGDDSDFKRLVSLISTTINPGTILFELTRLNVVEKDDQEVKLLRQMQGYQKAPDRGFEIVAQDYQDLFFAAEENLLQQEAVANLHIRTVYDNVVKRELPRIRRWLLDEGKLFHKRAREFISQFDMDVSPELTDQEGGGKVVVTAYSYTSPLSEAETENRNVA